MISGRRNWRQKLSEDFKGGMDKTAWFHCASLGEFEQGRTVIESFGKEFPDYKILLTFYSPSGFEIRKNYPGVHAVHYLPWDTEANAVKFIELVNPRIVFMIKYEFWYHFLKTAYDGDIPVILCSALFNSKQIFFKPYGNFFKILLTYFEHLFVQDKTSKDLLSTISISPVTIAGDTRMDRVRNITMECKSDEKVQRFAAGGRVMIIGSSWPQDIEVLAPLINEELTMKFIIAPHEINQHHLSQIDRLIKRTTARYNEPEDPTRAEVLIIDTIGLLSHLYQYADFAYIGGAFGKGLHNILEAATFGIPLFFGNKNYQKFREARKLVSLGGAFAIGNSSELQQQLNLFTNDSELYGMASETCHQYVLEQTGATEVIMEHVKILLGK